MTASSPTANSEISRTLNLGRTNSRLTRLLLWAVLVAALLAAAGAGIWYRYVRVVPTQYRTDEVKRGPLVVTVTATGTLEPVNSVEVGTEISGHVQAVHADFNDEVKRGQVLAELNTDQLTAKVMQSKAALASVQASVNEAQATLYEQRLTAERAQALAASNNISRADLEVAQASLARAEAGTTRAKAQVTVARAVLAADQLNLDKASIRSPINGVVLSRTVEPGQTVTASFQTPVLFLLAEDLTRMELHVDLDEADMGQVQVGQSGTFTVDAYPERRFPAHLTMVRNSPKNVQGVVTYEGLLDVDNKGLLLRPGMTATANIVTHTRDAALLVPNGALRFTPPAVAKANENGLHAGNNGVAANDQAAAERAQEGGGIASRVWVLRDGTPVSIPVTTGLSDGSVTEVLSGDVAPGMAVLVDVLTAKK